MFGGSRFPRVANMEPAVELLCERGYIAEVITLQQGAGRPPKVYEVNRTLTKNWN